MSRRSYRYHQDPSHGWIEVPFQELVELHLAPKMTDYSFFDIENRVAYLEEDLDAARFLTRRKLVDGQAPYLERVYHEHCAPCCALMAPLSRFLAECMKMTGERTLERQIAKLIGTENALNN